MKTSSALAIMAITITGIVGTVVVIASGHDPSGLFGLFSSIITGVMVLYKVDRVDNTIDRVDHNVNGHLSRHLTMRSLTPNQTYRITRMKRKMGLMAW